MHATHNQSPTRNSRACNRATLLAVRQRWTAIAHAETGESSRVCCVGSAADDAQQLLRTLCTGTYHVPADRCLRPYVMCC